MTLTETVPTLDIETERLTFEERFPLEMSMLRVGGVYPGESEPQVNPYTGELDTEYFGNIGEHCIAVVFAAESIMNSLWRDDFSQKDNVMRRALVHDATKRREIERRKAVEAGVIEDAYSPEAYATIVEVFDESLDPEFVNYLVNAGSETGHNSLIQFVESDAEGNPVLVTENIADMIVHLADDIYYHPGRQRKSGNPISDG